MTRATTEQRANIRALSMAIFDDPSTAGGVLIDGAFRDRRDSLGAELASDTIRALLYLRGTEDRRSPLAGERARKIYGVLDRRRSREWGSGVTIS